MLDNFPRVSLAHLPTPLEHLPKLSKQLGGPEIWVKRDDCTGLATGGNKTRKLEFSMAAALAEDRHRGRGAVESRAPDCSCRVQTGAGLRGSARAPGARTQ